TQTELAKLLGVSIRSIQNWEAGENYPKDGRLRNIIETFLQLRGFEKGHEREEAARLWEQVNQDAPHKLGFFDETWFNNLLAELEPGVAAVPESSNIPAATTFTNSN